MKYLQLLAWEVWHLAGILLYTQSAQRLVDSAPVSILAFISPGNFTHRTKKYDLDQMKDIRFWCINDHRFILMLIMLMFNFSHSYFNFVFFCSIFLKPIFDSMFTSQFTYEGQKCYFRARVISFILTSCRSNKLFGCKWRKGRGK